MAAIASDKGGSAARMAMKFSMRHVIAFYGPEKSPALFKKSQTHGWF
jgi:hypothetical protein